MIKIALAAAVLALTACKRTQPPPPPAEQAQATDPHAGHDMHGGHGGPKVKRIDPGPRIIALAERLAEEAAAAREIGPVKPDGYWGAIVPNPDDPDADAIILSDAPSIPEEMRGKSLGLCGKADVMISRARPHALSALEVNIERQADATAMHAQMDHNEHQHCMQQVVNDLYSQKGITLDHDLAFQMVLHATVRDGKAIIDDVEADWPEEVVADAQSCFVSAFRGVEYPTTASKSYSFTFPVCMQMGKVAANDSAQEHEEGVPL